MCSKKCGKWRVDFCFLFGAGLHFTPKAPPPRSSSMLCIRNCWPTPTHTPTQQHTPNRLSSAAAWPLGVFNRTKFQFEFHFLFRYAHLGFCLSNFCLLSLALRVVFCLECIFFFTVAIVFHFVSFCFQMQPASSDHENFWIERAF